MRIRSTSVKSLSVDDVRAENVDVLFLVWLLARSTYDLLDAVLTPSGLTADEFAIYSILSAAEHITPTELARWMAAAPTTVSSHVKRFESRGHVTREPNPDDGRSYRLRLTSAGHEAHARAREHFGSVRNHVEEALGEQHTIARDTLQQLRGVIDALRGDALPVDGDERR